MQRFVGGLHLINKTSVMKKIIYNIFAAILVIAASLSASAQATRQVSGFSRIASSGPFDVHVNINGTESLKINASQDVISQIETIVEDGKLEIRFKDHDEDHGNIGKVDIYVTAKSLSALINAGSGSIKVQGVVSGNNVDVVLSGSGDIESSIKSGELTANLSGSGSIHLNGTAGTAKINISGSGEVMAKQLKIGSASVSIAGSGSAYFNADKSISAHIVGSGNVIYSGNASLTDVKTIGSGNVSKAN
jgi:hypothetical protein